MPTRMIREGWIDSETVAQLTARANRGDGPAGPGDRLLGFIAEVTYLRLSLVVDDFGRIDGRIGPLHCKLWPLREPQDPSELELLEALALLQRPHLVTGKRLVSAYEVDGRPFLEIARFGQRMRAMRSKCPEPPTPAQGLDAMQKSGNDGHMTGKRPADDGLKLKLEASVSNIPPVLIGAESAKPVHKSRPTRMKTTVPETVRKPVDNTPPPSEEWPPADVDELPEPRPKLAKPAKLPDRWQSTRQGIEDAGRFLDMPRLPQESDSSYMARLTARIQLETA